MTAGREVNILYYRYAGSFWFLEITERCEECDITYAILQQLMADVFDDYPVTLEVRPWLDNWHRALLRGGWHAPIVLVNGEIFSQGIVPDAARLIRRVGKLLHSQDLIAKADQYPAKKPVNRPGTGPTLYYSPACPHCLQMQRYLDANEIEYELRDVTGSAAARSELQELTGGLSIPVLHTGEGTVSGFDRSRARDLLGISAEQEKHPEREVEPRSPSVDPETLRRAMADARQLLARNRTEQGTRASSHLYPHQWNWDSGFVARGYLHDEPELAYRELRSLFGAQWSDGFLPHIVFNPDYLDHFPGPDFWKAERSGRVPDGYHTSGISQPPVHASMLRPAPELDPNRDRGLSFLEEMYPRLRSLHDFFFKHRTRDDGELVCLVHPWESGLDNAPIWDAPLSRVTGTSEWARRMQRKYDRLADEGERPDRNYIEKYSYLVQRLFSRGYDWAEILGDHDFLVQDVLFNSILCRAERDLAAIAEDIGRSSELHRDRAARLAEAINEQLWDDEAGLYYSRDVVAGQPIRRDTVFSYLPLYAGICNDARADRLMENLRSHCFCVADRQCVGIPTYDMCKADFEGDLYWRGPVWFNMCWYMARGLRRYGRGELADWIEKSLLQLVAEQGFYEYYNPQTGEGLGASGFSWTAALFIDLAARREEEHDS